VSALFGIMPLVTGGIGMWVGILNAVCAAIYIAVPLLYRFGELVAPVTFVLVA